MAALPNAPSRSRAAAHGSLRSPFATSRDLAPARSLATPRCARPAAVRASARSAPRLPPVAGRATLCRALARFTHEDAVGLASLLLDRAPFILFDDFYASCAVLGGTAYLLVDLAGATGRAAAVVCAVVTVATRLLAVTRDWELPTVQGLGLAE